MFKQYLFTCLKKTNCRASQDFYFTYSTYTKLKNILLVKILKCINVSIPGNPGYLFWYYYSIIVMLFVLIKIYQLVIFFTGLHLYYNFLFFAYPGFSPFWFCFGFFFCWVFSFVGYFLLFFVFLFMLLWFC